MKFTGITAAFLATLASVTATAIATPKAADAAIDLVPRAVEASSELQERQVTGIVISDELRETLEESIQLLLNQNRDRLAAFIQSNRENELDPTCPAPVQNDCKTCVTNAQTGAISAAIGCGVVTARAVLAAAEAAPAATILGFCGFLVCEGGVKSAYGTALLTCKRLQDNV